MGRWEVWPNDGNRTWGGGSCGKKTLFKLHIVCIFVKYIILLHFHISTFKNAVLGGSGQMITILHRGGSGQMITVLHRGGSGQMITILHGGGAYRDPQK